MALITYFISQESILPASPVKSQDMAMTLTTHDPVAVLDRTSDLVSAYRPLLSLRIAFPWRDHLSALGNTWKSPQLGNF